MFDNNEKEKLKQIITKSEIPISITPAEIEKKLIMAKNKDKEARLRRISPSTAIIATAAAVAIVFMGAGQLFDNPFSSKASKDATSSDSDSKQSLVDSQNEQGTPIIITREKLKVLMEYQGNGYFIMSDTNNTSEYDNYLLSSNVLWYVEDSENYVQGKIYAVHGSFNTKPGETWTEDYNYIEVENTYPIVSIEGTSTPSETYENQTLSMFYYGEGIFICDTNDAYSKLGGRRSWYVKEDTSFVIGKAYYVTGDFVCYQNEVNATHVNLKSIEPSDELPDADGVITDNKSINVMIDSEFTILADSKNEKRRLMIRYLSYPYDIYVYDSSTNTQKTYKYCYKEDFGYKELYLLTNTSLDGKTIQQYTSSSTEEKSDELLLTYEYGKKKEIISNSFSSERNGDNTVPNNDGLQRCITNLDTLNEYIGELPNNDTVKAYKAEMTEKLSGNIILAFAVRRSSGSAKLKIDSWSAFSHGTSEMKVYCSEDKSSVQQEDYIDYYYVVVPGSYKDWVNTTYFTVAKPQ